jgi:hypothetical protein
MIKKTYRSSSDVVTHEKLDEVIAALAGLEDITVTVSNEVEIKNDAGSPVPISAASLPLPTGASTLAEQQTQTTSLQLIDDVVNAINTALNKAVAIAGQFDDTATTAATEDNIAPFRITAQRALHINTRLSNGTEIDPRQAFPGSVTMAAFTAVAASSVALAANSSRKYLIIHNPSVNVMWFNFGTAAVSAAPSIRIGSGSTFVMEGSFVSTQAIHVIRATANVDFSIGEGS